jgi:hypothetical protein
VCFHIEARSNFMRPFRDLLGDLRLIALPFRVYILISACLVFAYFVSLTNPVVGS